MNTKKPKIIISGGGTGGHIFPAISIANAIKKINNESIIHFVGAEGRMEMQRIPDAGYSIDGLPVAGFDRKHLWKNIQVLIKLWKSQRKAKMIIKSFQPDVVVGVGGYASGPTLNVAHKLGIPTLIQEQNSYAGITNKILSSGANKICVAYDNMENFFPKEKILLTGNPVRQTLLKPIDKKSAAAKFGLDIKKPILLIVGGSLGARTINESVLEGLDKIKEAEIQLIWQTGKYYYNDLVNETEKIKDRLPEMYLNAFIKEMPEAYAAADLVISRAGASSISELCLLGKPSLLVPSPNVAEDHQTKNAMALVNKDAAEFVPDKKAKANLINHAITLINDTNRLEIISTKCSNMARKNAAKIIATEVLKLVK